MKKKKVLIALKMSGIAGQMKLAGIFKYLKERYGDSAPWDIELIRSREEYLQGRLVSAIGTGTQGFIISIPETENLALPLAQTSIPAIVMDIDSPEMEKRRKNTVFIRNAANVIGEEAARFLMGQGIARAYAFLHADPVTAWSKNRFSVFKETLNRAGIWCEELFRPSDAEKLKRPAAILAAHDDRAYELVKHLSGKRIKIPQHIAVLGVDNDVLICENAHPRISSIEPDFEKEGHTAARMLDRMMAKGAALESQTILVGIRQIVRRESTSEHSSAGKLVEKALAYIERHACEGIDVGDVVRHMKCSRRLADLRFGQLQGRSMLETITDRRLREVKRLLSETKDKTDAIALACGFRNPNYLKNLFKRKFGMTMRDFRRSAAPRAKRNGPQERRRAVPGEREAGSVFVRMQNEEPQKAREC